MEHIIVDEVVIIYCFWQKYILIRPDVRVKDFFHFLVDGADSLCEYKLNRLIVLVLFLLF